MSLPIEADFAVVKMGNGATPTEVFTIMCGMDDVGIERTANTTDRFRRDCATPGVVPYRRAVATGKQMDVTASGAVNIPDIASYNTALGVSKNYRIELGRRDGTSTGVIIHVINGPFVLTNAGTSVGGEGNAQVSLVSDGIWTEGAP